MAGARENIRTSWCGLVCALLLLLLPVRFMAAPGSGLSDGVVIRWPNPDGAAVERLRELGAAAVITPLAGSDGRELAASVSQAGMIPVAEVPSGSAEVFEDAIRSARRAGFKGVAFDAFGSEKSTREALGVCGDLLCFVGLSEDRIDWDVSPAKAVLRYGQWPGIHPRDPGDAGATEAPWIDANSYLVAFLRATHPERAAWLGYRPDGDAGVPPDRMLPYHSVELGLIEAFAVGGNVVLSLPERFRAGLAADDPKALAAWRSLTRTAEFLREHRQAMARPRVSLVAAFAANVEEHGEILNLLFRSNLTPLTVSAAAPAIPGGVKVVIAAAASRASSVALEFARRGGTVLAAPGQEDDAVWWPAGNDSSGAESITWLPHGSGKIAVYSDPVYDPADFALDVIEAVGRQRRGVRIWGPETVVAILHEQPRGRSLELINYGAAAEHFLVRVEEEYSVARLLRPEEGPLELKSSRRSGGTEIEIPVLRRLARLILE